MKQRLLSLLAALGMFAVLVLPASAEIGLSITDPSILNGAGTATVQVTFTCTYTGSFSVSGEVNQKFGHLTSYGNGGVHGACEAGQQVVEYLDLVPQGNLPFRPGSAHLSVSVFNWEEGSHDTPENQGMDTGRLMTVIRLQR